jgi:hypothetical protein
MTRPARLRPGVRAAPPAPTGAMLAAPPRDPAVIAVGGELHADEEAALLDDGRQHDLWGINLYPGERGDGWIEFDSMINVRPAQGNRSRDVEDEARRAAIRGVVSRLVPDA